MLSHGRPHTSEHATVIFWHCRAARSISGCQSPGYMALTPFGPNQPQVLYYATNAPPCTTPMPLPSPLPGYGDFHPLEAHPGQCVRFWGNQCEHYTVLPLCMICPCIPLCCICHPEPLCQLPNEEDITRVSLDFRVVCVISPPLPSPFHHPCKSLFHKTRISTFV